MKMNLWIGFLLFSLVGNAKVQERQLFPDDSTAVKNKRYVNSIQAVGRLSIFTTAVGMRYTGALSLKKYPKIGVGPSIFFEQLSFKKGIKFPPKVVEARLQLYTPGLNIEFGLHSLIGFQTGFSILIGNEIVTKINAKGVSEKAADMVGGFQAEQNLILRTSKTNGLKIGIGVFERFVTSYVYEGDVGGSLYVGFEFQ